MGSLKIGVLGAGSFGGAFISLFQAHPLVENVCVAETMPERLSQAADKFQIETTFTNFDDLLKSNKG